jgi:hypothetical protein
MCEELCCHETFLTYDACAEHMLYADHRLAPIELSPTDPIGDDEPDFEGSCLEYGDWACPGCGMRFSTFADARKHIQLVHPADPGLEPTVHSDGDESGEEVELPVGLREAPHCLADDTGARSREQGRPAPKEVEEVDWSRHALSDLCSVRVT